MKEPVATIKQRKRNRKYYNRWKYVEDVRVQWRASSSASYRRNRDRILEYKLSHPCVDCGETNPIVLDFDHRDPKEKEFTIGRFHGSFDRLLKEIEKCDVRCSNCHRIKTHEQRKGGVIRNY